MIPIPEEILSSVISAKMNNNGILRIELPKKTPTKLEEIKGRSITVECQYEITKEKRGIKHILLYFFIFVEIM